MNRRIRLWTAFAGLMALAAAFLAVGCGGGGSSESGVQLLLSDAPMDAAAVDVTISRIDVSTDGEGWVTLKEYEPALTVNLLDYRYDGSTATPDQYLLADTPLDPGHYTQIRLILTKVEIEDTDGNRFDCAMSSQDETGLKIVGGFDVAPGTKSAVLVDFDAGKSIVAQGNGSYLLKPTVRVVPLQVTGSIKGVIAFKDAGGVDVSVPEGASITASQGGVFVASSPVIADGSFLIPALLAGSYDLQLEFADGATVTYALPVPTTAVVSVGADTDLGALTATAVP